MEPTTQFECMDKNCNTIILDDSRQDGIRCPRCDGPVFPFPYDVNKAQLKTNSKCKYTCLICTHTEVIESTKEDHQEVRVCPMCYGALVDKWNLAKYPPKVEKETETEIDIKPLLTMKILTINEVRKRFGLKPIPNGNELYTG
jgi:DNA-directed RNA polymerase subunit RPC12/RpoP